MEKNIFSKGLIQKENGLVDQSVGVNFSFSLRDYFFLRRNFIREKSQGRAFFLSILKYAKTSSIAHS